MARFRGRIWMGPMAEADWLACTSPVPMLYSLRDMASERKLRLFAVACCRRMLRAAEGSTDSRWTRHPDPRSRRAAEVAERYADACATAEELAAFHVARGSPRPVMFADAFHAADEVVKQATDAAGSAAWGPWPDAGTDFERVKTAEAAERAAQVALLRDLFGNPFRPVGFDPSWLSWNQGTIASLARTIYDGRTFDLLPILGDALQDAGCADEAILGHCRMMGEHVRGCWVIDLLLGKE
jgi:hypothetical protein